MSARPTPASSCAADAWGHATSVAMATARRHARRIAGGSLRLADQRGEGFVTRSAHLQRAVEPGQLEGPAGVGGGCDYRERVLVALQLLLRGHERLEHGRVDEARVAQVDNHVVG